MSRPNQQVAAASANANHDEAACQKNHTLESCNTIIYIGLVILMVSCITLISIMTPYNIHECKSSANNFLNKDVHNDTVSLLASYFLNKQPHNDAASLVILSIQVIIYLWFALDVLTTGKVTHNNKAKNANIKMAIFFCFFMVSETVPLRDISDRLYGGNVLFHACGYFRKVVLVMMVIHTHIWKTFVGKLGIALYACLVVVVYTNIAMSDITPFHILDTYTDTLANGILLIVVIIRAFSNSRRITIKYWFTLACVAEPLSCVYAIVLCYFTMDNYSLLTDSISIVFPVCIASLLQVCILLASETTELEEDNFVTSTRDVVIKFINFIRGGPLEAPTAVYSRQVNALPGGDNQERQTTNDNNVKVKVTLTLVPQCK